MADILVDTDVFIDHLRGARPVKTHGDTISYSSITRCELFAGSREEEPRVVRLLAPFAERPANREIAERAGRLCRVHGLAMADAIVAATAQEHQLTLVTRNHSDFAPVRSLKVRAPR